MSRRVTPNPPIPRARNGIVTWRTDDIRAVCEWFAGPPDEILELYTELIRRANRDSDGGFPSGGGERTSGGRYGDDGSENGRVPNVALRRIENDESDSVACAARGFFASLASAALSLRDAAKHARYLAALDQETAAELLAESRPERGAACVNPACGRWVENTTNDRIRAGRCHSCFTYWTRHQRMEDRSAEMCVEAEQRRSA